MPSSSNTNAATRWNLVISEQTNVAVRSFLARRGFKKGDLSSFVEEAVRWRVFDQMLGQAREGLDGLAVMDAESLLDEALSEVRDEGLGMHGMPPSNPRRYPWRLCSGGFTLHPRFP